MSQEYEDEVYVPPHFGVFSQAKIVGGTFASTALLDVALHGGVGGLILAGGASYVALQMAPIVYPWMQDVHAAWERAVQDRREKRLAQEGDYDEQSIESEPLTPVPMKGTLKGTLPAPVVTDVLDETAVDTGNLVPRAPAFRDMCHLISEQRMPLCYVVVNGVSVPLYGTLEDILSMAIVGIPGQGKTTALMYYVSILLKYGAEVYVWDPHGVMTELAQLNGAVLPNMPTSAKLTYLDRKQDIFDSVEPLNAELDKRDNEYRECQRRRVKYENHPLVLLADELPVLANYEAQMQKKVELANKRLARDEEPMEAPSLIDLIQKFVLEARKWYGVFIGSGQSTDAKVLPTRVTECLSSRIVFFSSDRRARMAGLEQADVQRFMPMLKSLEDSRGIMIFDGVRFKDVMLGAIPSISVADMMDFLMGSTPPYREEVKQAPSYAPPVQSNANELATILGLLESGQISEQTMLRLIDALPVVQSDDEVPQEALHRSTMPVGKLVLPGMQPVSYAAPTQRIGAPAMREQRAQHLYALPKATEMEDLPVQAVEQKSEGSGHFSATLSPELQRALDTFRPGMSYRDLADAMTQRYQVKVNKDKAGMFIKMLKERHLITG